MGSNSGGAGNQRFQEILARLQAKKAAERAKPVSGEVAKLKAEPDANQARAPVTKEALLEEIGRVTGAFSIGYSSEEEMLHIRDIHMGKEMDEEVKNFMERQQLYMKEDILSLGDDDLSKVLLNYNNSKLNKESVDIICFVFKPGICHVGFEANVASGKRSRLHGGRVYTTSVFLAIPVNTGKKLMDFLLRGDQTIIQDIYDRLLPKDSSTYGFRLSLNLMLDVDGMKVTRDRVNNGKKPTGERQSGKTESVPVTKEELVEEIKIFGGGYVISKTPHNAGFHTTDRYIGNDTTDEIRNLSEEAYGHLLRESKLVHEIDIQFERDRRAHEYHGACSSVHFRCENEHTLVGFEAQTSLRNVDPRGVQAITVLLLPHPTAEKLFNFLKQGEIGIILELYKDLFPENYEYNKIKLAPSVKVIMY